MLLQSLSIDVVRENGLDISHTNSIAQCVFREKLRELVFETGDYYVVVTTLTTIFH